MFDVNRRSFIFGGAKVAAAVAVASQVPSGWFEELPKLVGDGVQDDTAALQALFDGGKAVLPDGTAISGRGGVHVLDGVYRLTDTLVIREDGTEISGGRYLIDHNGHGVWVDVSTVPNVRMGNMHFSFIDNDQNTGSAAIYVHHPQSVTSAWPLATV